MDSPGSRRGWVSVVGLLLGLPLALGLLRDRPDAESVAVAVPEPQPTAASTDPVAASEPAASADPPDAATRRQWQRDADARMPAMDRFAADCFASLRARNPVGRLLAVSATRVADSCAAVVETAAGSGRWLFDYREQDGGFRHYGEVLWPEVWPKAPSLPAEATPGETSRVIADLDPGEFDAARIAAVVGQIDVAENDAAHQYGHWLYEPIWLPTPFERTVVFVTVRLFGDDNGPNESSTYVLAGDEWLEDERRALAQSMYPSTRFELAEDHNFKGPLFESTALAESTISLEGAPQEAAHPLATLAEGCLAWVRDTAPGSRVLRLGLADSRCWLTLAREDDRARFHVLSYDVADQQVTERGDVQYTAPPVNFMLDRSRLTAARIREQLAQVTTHLGQSTTVLRMAITWIDGQMVWQFVGYGQSWTDIVYLDAAGRKIDPPAAYPVSAYEVGVGFPSASNALPPASTP